MGLQWITQEINGRQVTFCDYEFDYASGEKGQGTEYLATRNSDGTFTVATRDAFYENVPSMGEFDNYREMDEFADFLFSVRGETQPYVCHVNHNDNNAYVLMAPKKSYYIRIED